MDLSRAFDAPTSDILQQKDRRETETTHHRRDEQNQQFLLQQSLTVLDIAHVRLEPEDAADEVKRQNHRDRNRQTQMIDVQQQAIGLVEIFRIEVVVHFNGGIVVLQRQRHVGRQGFRVRHDATAVLVESDHARDRCDENAHVADDPHEPAESEINHPAQIARQTAGFAFEEHEFFDNRFQYDIKPLSCVTVHGCVVCVMLSVCVLECLCVCV